MEYNEIERLKNELKELQFKEKWDSLQKEFQKIKEKYLDRYYASHNFRYSRLKQYKNNILSLLHINKVYIGELYGDTIIETFEQFKSFYDKERLFVICEGKSKRISKTSAIQITISKTRDVAHRITGFDKEIDENTYNNIDSIVTEAIELIFNTPIKNVPHFDYIESDPVKILKQYGETFIDVSPEQVNSLEGHPFLYLDNKLLVNDLTKQIIEDRIKEERKADAEDVDYFFYGERIRRIGNHAKILNNLIEVLNKIKKIDNIN